MQPTAPWKRFVFALLPEGITSPTPHLDRLAIAHTQRRRVVQFRHMCDILASLDGTDAAVHLLPWEVIEAVCALRDDRGKEHEYHGLLLKQRRADHFFDYFTGVDRFDWEQLVTAQHSLWRRGIGFTDADEVLGPRNWALLDDRLQLGDTGSLTRDFRRVRQIVSESVLDACQQRIPIWWPDRSDRQLGTYFAFVRREINVTRLHQLWRTDLPTNHRYSP
jgi:hypothetical protein